MDTTQFILAIVTNIIAAIIIWAYTRLTRRARNSLTSGTITEKVSNIFAPNRINIVGSLSTALLNFWTLGKFTVSQPSFTRFELFAAIALSLLTFYWAERVTAAVRNTTERRLETTRQDLLGTQVKMAELEQHSMEVRERLLPRTLKAEQRSQALAILKEGAKGFVLIQSAVAPEPIRLAGAIWKLLTEAGWQACRSSLMQNIRPDLFGAELLIFTPRLETPGVAPLREALAVVDLQALVVLDEGQLVVLNEERKEQYMTLFIGEKVLVLMPPEAKA